MIKKYLEIGRIVGTHAIKGEVRVQPWADSGEFLLGFRTLYYAEGKEKISIVSSRVHKNVVIMKIKGVDSVEAADVLRGKVLYMDRADAKLPEGRYFIQDLIGLKVIDAQTSEVYGEIADVSQTLANDIYHAITPQGKECLIPAIDEVLSKTDVEAGYVAINAMKGMFDDED